MSNVKCQMSKIKCQMPHVNKVKLLSERTSGNPPVIFLLVSMTWEEPTMSYNQAPRPYGISRGINSPYFYSVETCPKESNQTFSPGFESKFDPLGDPLWDTVLVSPERQVMESIRTVLRRCLAQQGPYCKTISDSEVIESWIKESSFRVVKCHRYSRYICVKILEGWGKKCNRTRGYAR